MKINVEFLSFPMASDMIGKKKLEVEISKDTVRDVIHELINYYGKKMRDTFYDSNGNLDPMIQIAVNGQFVFEDKYKVTHLKEGDKLIFMILLSGG